MENNKYLDKVVGSLVRSTKLDYDREEIIFPFYIFASSRPLRTRFHLFYLSSPFLFSLFSDYCRGQFGLTKEEIDYVFKQYKNIILDKIEDGEQ